jgi:hypothetical protein
MNAYLLSHNGLGDNITMIGAINFLLKYYANIYFLCKDTNVKNIKAFFPNKPVHILAFPAAREFTQPTEIIEHAATNPTNDIFVCGFAHKHIAKYRRVQNPKFLEYKPNDKNYSIKPQWQHIPSFYRDIGMDLSIYYEYFDIPSPFPYTNTPISKEYNIIFAHTKGSDKEIQILDVIAKYTDNENTIIICANKNVYPTNHPKYELANQYVNIPIAHYIDIIKRATEIHIVTSCFSCIVYPLQQTNRLSAKTVKIYDRTPEPKKSYKMRMQFGR